MLRIMLAVLTTLITAGCVSSHMKQYVGKDIREVVLENGKPDNIFDYIGNKRVFQFYWGGGTIVTPTTSKTYGNATIIGSTVYGNSTTIQRDGHVIENKGCLISYITQWSEKRQGWIVTDYKYPKRIFC